MNSLENVQEFPRTTNFYNQVAEDIAQIWTRQLLSVPKKGFWFARMAILKATGGGGGFIVKRNDGSGLSYTISYANKGKYNYFRVIEYGRPRYDMKPGLLASPRARSGKNGRYIIISFGKNTDGSKVSPRNNNFNSVLTKTSSRKESNADGKKQVRNTHSSRRDPGTTGRGNASITEQKQKGGSVHRSYMKFVVLSEKSGGWFYPEIPAAHTIPKMKVEIKKKLSSPATRKGGAIAAIGDVISYAKKRNIPF